MADEPELESGAGEDELLGEDLGVSAGDALPAMDADGDAGGGYGAELDDERPALAALELMLDVPLDVTVELGRASMQLGEALALQPGSIIELNRLPGEPLDMHINDRLVARGEVVVVSETLGLRVTEIVGREPRKARSALLPAT